MAGGKLINIIYKQKSEIKKLHKIIESMTNDQLKYGFDVRDKIVSQSNEIELLKIKNERLMDELSKKRSCYGK